MLFEHAGSGGEGGVAVHLLRSIEREAAGADYKWSALVLGIVKSTPFQMRRSES